MPTATLQLLSFPRRQLAAHLSVLASLANRKTLPVLSCVRIRAEDGEAALEATDLDTRIRLTMPCEGEADIVLPAKLLSDLVHRLSGESVEITVDGLQATVRAGRSKTTIPGMAPDEWPTERASDWSDPLTLPMDVLRRVVGVSFACSEEVTRPIMRGVWLHTVSNRLAAVGADGPRLALVESDLVAEVDAILPAAGLSYVLKILGEESAVELRRSENVTSLRGGGAEVLLNTISGPYPNYRGIMPTDYGSLAVLNRLELMDALKRVLLLAVDDLRSCACTFTEEGLRITSAKGGQIDEEVALESFTGDGMTIGFNAQYVAEMLAQLQAPLVEFELRSPSRAVTIRGGNDDPLLLLMPINLLPPEGKGEGRGR